MPGNLLFADSVMPKQTGDAQKDIAALTDYIKQLQEELRYTMGNLGAENFNAQGILDMRKELNGGSLTGISSSALFSADPAEMAVGDTIYAIGVSAAGITGYKIGKAATGTISVTASTVLYS